MRKISLVSIICILAMPLFLFSANQNSTNLPNITVNAYSIENNNNSSIDYKEISWSFKPIDFTISRIKDETRGEIGMMILTGIVKGKKYQCIIFADYTELLLLHQSMMLLDNGLLNCLGTVNGNDIYVNIIPFYEYQGFETYQLVSNSTSAIDTFKMMHWDDIVNNKNSQNKDFKLKDNKLKIK